MSDDNEMAAAAVATMREAMARALGCNCTFVDDDGFLLATLARRAIDAGLAGDLDDSVIHNMKRRDELQDELARLRAREAELVEALELARGHIARLRGEQDGG